jgi:hypothetical protein
VYSIENNKLYSNITTKMAKEKKEKKEKKAKKDKKSKKSKKERKSSKNDRKKGDHRRKEGEQQSAAAQSNTLSAFLNASILKRPSLLDEIPHIAKSLDDGEYITVETIGDTVLKSFLSKLLTFLPVLFDPNNGWYKNARHVNVSAVIMQLLSNEGSIRKPSAMNMSESYASQNTTTKLLSLVTKFPDLKGELQGLLTSVIQGSCVQLDDLDNEDIRDALEEFFRAVGLECSASGYGLPEGRRHDMIKEAMGHLAYVFAQYMQYEDHHAAVNIGSRGSSSSSSSSSSSAGGGGGGGGGGASSSHRTEGNRTTSRSRSSSTDSDSNNSHSSDSSSGGASNSDASGAEDEEETGPAATPAATAVLVKGPSMPSVADLRAAQAFMQQNKGVNNSFGEEGEDDDDDDEGDDVVGPQVCDPRVSRLLQLKASAQPLGFAGADLDASFETAFIADNLGVEAGEVDADGNPRKRTKYTGEAHAVEEEGKREEWLLTPGNSELAG